MSRELEQEIFDKARKSEKYFLYISFEDENGVVKSLSAGTFSDQMIVWLLEKKKQMVLFESRNKFEEGLEK